MTTGGSWKLKGDNRFNGSSIESVNQEPKAAGHLAGGSFFWFTVREDDIPRLRVHGARYFPKKEKAGDTVPPPSFLCAELLPADVGHCVVVACREDVGLVGVVLGVGIVGAHLQPVRPVSLVLDCNRLAGHPVGAAVQRHSGGAGGRARDEGACGRAAVRADVVVLEAVGAVSRGDTDMTAALSRIAADGPQGILFPLFPDEAGYVIRQIGDVDGLEEAVLINSESLIYTSLESVGAYLPGPEFSFGDNVNETTGRSGDELYMAYRQQYRESPNLAYLALAYDATTLLLHAVEEVAVADPHASSPK